jgi:predicted DsbA family dithiol-disulfide isomerase
MKKIEMFFDYLCPYCLLGHEQLVEFFEVLNS